VIDCGESEGEIAAAIERALSSDFREGIEGQALPYGVGDASTAICRVLRDTPLGADLLQKHFHDLPVPAERSE
jgi:hypothetical protein